MSKIARAFQKIFAGNVSPTGNITKIGSTASGSTVYTNDPATIQALSLFTDVGWSGATVGNQSPVLQDFNALCFLITRQLAYLFQQGTAEWDSGTTYYTGSLCTNASFAGTIYYSVQDTNLNHAVTDTNWWLPIRPPAPTASLLGGAKSLSASGSNFLTGLDTTGAFTRRQPTTSDISGLAPVASSGDYNDLINKPTNGMAKAWVYFNGNTGSILSSYNVSSITKNGNGDYTANFSIDMGTTNYLIIGNGSMNGNPGSTGYPSIFTRTPDIYNEKTTTSCRFFTIDSTSLTSANGLDVAEVYVVFYGP